ncbi:MAG: peptidoglycan-associated lipoprotein Pal [Deltaproteobacteria bacterium]|nr:peptidoglycan-associated lipoprotein Pal [Deltaproteobacteria bacterium]
MMREKRWIWKVLLLVLLLVFLPQCQRKVVREERAITPEQERGERAFEESLTKKKYPGIKGEVLESALLKDIHFEFDRYDLIKEARGILAENAKVLVAHPNLRIQIEGHCDERGSNEYNLALGERRAVSAKLYLVKLGVKGNRLSTISYGEEMPLDPRHNEEAWAKNRRCHFVILSR